ncbi:adenylate kinase, putative [Phytophthora infestans T30-4]|uniref:Adenylate kinase, putative n=1 Tax=Phytophthora infestans (strain T30-4) TaxID=403677 RepID=D0N5H9_PHYIT|nr:adenylate kinase, putative [Phytophthora infestans T30-4]EEY70320.1 adenylate kinase, putative [Phytophthora infestans T30-4]|eukprot:XP_002997974.1 adenylate kinase, putative [Phytophthora infestans T30-4]
MSTVVHVDAAKSRDATTKKLVLEIHRARGSRGPFRARNPPQLIITGPPVSGKGTQCELLVRALDVVHLSTGEMLRQAIRDGTSLGQQAQGYMDNGQLVPDELIVGVVLERLALPDCKSRGWLLDGFPRTEAQALALLAARIAPDCVLALDVADDQVVKRIAGRRLDPETGKTYHMELNPPPSDVAARVIQRSDDTEETVRTRLQQYHAHSEAVVSTLSGVCELIQADGTRSVDQVAEQLLGGAERCLLRNNAAIISLFSMNSMYQTRASLFLANGTFQIYPSSSNI